jgi:hypothetical protein
MHYANGGQIRVGNVVSAGEVERYIVVGLEQNDVVRLLQIGTVQKDDAPSLGEIVFIPQGFTNTVPADVLTRIGSARITIVDEDPQLGPESLPRINP